MKHYIQDGGLRLRLQSAYDLLRELQRKRDLIYMFFSHDLRVVAALAGHLAGGLGLVDRDREIGRFF